MATLRHRAIWQTLKTAEELGLTVTGYWVVEVPLPEFDNADTLEAMFNWVEDEARLGFYDYTSGLNKRWKAGARFWFTNEQLAFEFKMRWA